MPTVYDGGNFETEMVTIPKIKELHESLLKEDIAEQLKNPFDAKVDMVETFNQQIEESMEDAEDEDEKKKINELRLAFYTDVIGLIDEKFHLDCDIDTISEKNLDDVSDICEAMYSFFVIKLKKNIKNMMLNYILANTNSICEALDYLKKKKDVTTMGLRKKIDDPDISMIAANLQEVLSYIKSLDISMDEMIKNLDLDLFNNSIVNDLMTDCTINSNFQVFYFAPLWSYQDCNYDDILAKIEHGIVKSLKKSIKFY